jgi:hypothetical protein
MLSQQQQLIVRVNPEARRKSTDLKRSLGKAKDTDKGQQNPSIKRRLSSKPDKESAETAKMQS